MTASTTARKPSSTARKPASSSTAQLKAVPAKPQPEQKPAATIDTGATQVTVWFPKATLADGTVVQCSHQRYGHESQKAAAACIRSLVAKAGYRVA